MLADRHQLQHLLRGRRAVILDVETTDLDGPVCEIAVIDTTGRVLLDTLVRPELPIDPAATAVHGLRDEDVATAPVLRHVLPRLLDVTRGRTVIAYNALFDRAALSASAPPYALAHLADSRSLWCAMRARRVLEHTPAWQPLEGGHRAGRDVQATLRLLRRLQTRS